MSLSYLTPKLLLGRAVSSQRLFVSGSYSGIQNRKWTSLSRDLKSLTVHSLNNTRFPYVWLRDSCQGEESIHPSNRQKLHRTSDIPLDVAPIDDALGVRVTGEGLEIKWRDGRTSVYQKEWLERHASPCALESFHMDDQLKEESWTHSSISSAPSLFQDYKVIQETNKGFEEAISQLAKYGLLFVQGVPNAETSDDKCELKKLGERFGELRRTFYGLLWDVISLKDSKNIAYTNLDLGLHMDLLYFQHPPRYQILHCLRNQVVGGASIFVDALHVARVLRELHPQAFEILTKTPVSFHYINDGHHLHREHFTIELASPAPGSSQQEISHINYSPPFQAPLPLSTPEEFYPAFKLFADSLNDPKYTFEYTLKEGDAVLFDNRRVLHARTSFRDRTEDEWKSLDQSARRVEDREPARWLKGCYLEADALLDRVRVIKTKG